MISIPLCSRKLSRVNASGSLCYCGIDFSRFLSLLWVSPCPYLSKRVPVHTYDITDFEKLAPLCYASCPVTGLTQFYDPLAILVSIAWCFSKQPLLFFGYYWWFFLTISSSGFSPLWKPDAQLLIHREPCMPLHILFAAIVAFILHASFVLCGSNWKPSSSMNLPHYLTFWYRTRTSWLKGGEIKCHRYW